MRRLLALAGVLGVVLAPATAEAARIYGVTPDDELVSFDSANPAVLLSRGTIGGLSSGQHVVGLDWRPATGAFVLLTRTGDDVVWLSELDIATRSASSPLALQTPGGSPVLIAGSVGVDVDPVDDELRIMTADDENLRVDLADGTTTSSTPLPDARTIVASAYSNPDLDLSTASLLFSFDINSDDLLLHDPEDTASPANPGESGIISSGAAHITQLDIAPDGAALLTTYHVSDGQRLYAMDLDTGATTDLGAMAEPLTGMTAVNNVVSLADESVHVAESAGSVDVLVRRDALFDSPSVDPGFAVSLTAGSASTGDFDSSAGFFGFTNGDATSVVTIPIADDEIDEGPETFTVAIGPRSGTPVGDVTTTTVTIDDDDPVRVIETQTVTQTETRTVVEQPPPMQPPPIVLLPGRCANTRSGTADDDALAGTTAGDRLSGLGGADGLSGLAGDDCLSGGAGDDLLSGGAGDDELAGNGGSNRINGGPGADTVNARNRKRDVVDCGPGRDTITADRRDRLRRCERVTRRR